MKSRARSFSTGTTPTSSTGGLPPRPLPSCVRGVPGRSRRDPPGHPQRRAAEGHGADLVHHARADRLSRTRLAPPQGGRRGPRRGRRAAPGGDAAAAHLVPPGKVRFTIIDPVGLGENFAAFMHLADYDEQLVASRIWTETAAHRAAAGRPDRAHGERDPEVPAQRVRDASRSTTRRPARWPSRIRVLVVANFPANFTERGGPPAGQHRQQRRRAAACSR